VRERAPEAGRQIGRHADQHADQHAGQRAVVLLARELDSLHTRVRDWSPTRFSAAALQAEAVAAAVSPVLRGTSPHTRGDALHALVVALSRWGRQAGVAVPPGADPPRLGEHALADQLAVTAADLRGAPALDAVALGALRAVVAVRTAVDGAAVPSDVHVLLGSLPASGRPEDQPAGR
jgi:hypothetical protein